MRSLNINTLSITTVPPVGALVPAFAVIGIPVSPFSY